MLRNVIGKPVRGNDFYNREHEQRKIWQDLQSRNNVLMLAPRRVGKSSLLYRLERDAPRYEMTGVYVSVAEAKNEINFVERLLQALGRKPESVSLTDRFRKGFFKRIFEKVE